jgi:hypothetical protein
MSFRPRSVIHVPLFNRAEEQIGEAIVDSEDWDLVKNHDWYLHSGYARTQRDYIGHFMHRLIMGEPPNLGLEVDHINRNKLDNRKSNLRWVTRSMNNANRKVLSNTGYRGITYNSSSGNGRRLKCYMVSIKLGSLKKSESFYTLEEAIAVRKQWERELYGCNFD